MDANESRSRSLALAGGAMVAALLDVLHDKGILTKDEARTVLTNALTTGGAVSLRSLAQKQISWPLKPNIPGRFFP